MLRHVSRETDYVRQFLKKRDEIVAKHRNQPFVPTKIFAMRRGEEVGTSVPWCNYVSQVFPRVNWIHIGTAVERKDDWLVEFHGAIQLVQLLQAAKPRIKKFETPVQHYLLPPEELTTD